MQVISVSQLVKLAGSQEALAELVELKQANISRLISSKAIVVNGELYSKSSSPKNWKLAHEKLVSGILDRKYVEGIIDAVLVIYESNPEEASMILNNLQISKEIVISVAGIDCFNKLAKVCK